MASIEMQIITKRQIPKGLIETFNRQTSKDFTMKILARYPQQWKTSDLKIEFPLKLLPQKLLYSTGTRFALCLARNELLTHAESEYVLALDDFFIIPPFTVELLIQHLDENRIIQSIIDRGGPEFSPGVYDRSFKGLKLQGTLQPLVGNIIHKIHLWTGCMLFPMKTLRKVNGWNLAFDGGWGLDDGDLGKRMHTAGINYTYHPSFKARQLKHPSAIKQEKDDPPIGKGWFIINKETGKKMDIVGKQICLRGISAKAQSVKAWDSRHYLPGGRAEFGLEEVRRLL